MQLFVSAGHSTSEFLTRQQYELHESGYWVAKKLGDGCEGTQIAARNVSDCSPKRIECTRWVLSSTSFWPSGRTRPESKSLTSCSALDNIKAHGLSPPPAAKRQGLDAEVAIALSAVGSASPFAERFSICTQVEFPPFSSPGRKLPKNVVPDLRTLELLSNQH